MNTPTNLMNAQIYPNKKIEDSIKDQEKKKLKKNIIIASIIGIVIVITIVIVVIIVIVKSKKNTKEEKEGEEKEEKEKKEVKEEKEEKEEKENDIFPMFRLNTFFFFDPVTNEPCNENNYWTPFDQSTTCYRFVSITSKDSIENRNITIMLDHNIGTSNYIDYINVLKDKTANWSRHKDKYIIDIVEEETIFKIMKFKSKPDKTTTSVSPGLRVYYYYGNSDYIINGESTNEKGYWTKTKYDEDYSYAIYIDGYNTINSKTTVLGIRPVLTIEKSLLNIDSGLINITNIIRNGELINIKLERTLYDGYRYGGLQGLTVANGQLIFMSAINQIPSKSVMYSYKLDDFENIYKKDFSNTAHGNGMTYNSKDDKVLVIVNNDGYTVFEYNGETLIRETEHTRETFPPSSGIGYDYNSDLYIGRSDPRLFFFDITTNQRVFQFTSFMFEASQDLEYYNGYIFDCSSDFGEFSKYQNYSFFPGYEIIYIYETKLDQDKNPTKNFGRLIARLSMENLGELESISFRDGYVYIGFEYDGYTFYKLEYNEFVREIKKISDISLN